MCGDPDARLHTAHRRTSLKRGKSTCFSHLPWPLKDTDLPSASLGHEPRRVYSYGLQATGEVAQKRGPQPCTRPWPRPKGASSLFLSPGQDGRTPGGGSEDPPHPSLTSIFPGKASVDSTWALTPSVASAMSEIGFWQSQE